jgi:16S rRNA (adenine1518-N6/adenine1519-N6)-dimethyltransferase
MQIDARALHRAMARISSPTCPIMSAPQLLVRWLTSRSGRRGGKSLTLMFQKEVAERIVARRAARPMAGLAVLAQWRSEARIAFEGAPQRVYAAAEGDVRRGAYHAHAEEPVRDAADAGTPSPPPLSASAARC